MGPVYTYRVQATNGIGASSYSTSSGISVTEVLPNPPAAPSSLGATAISATQVNLTWVDNSDNELNFRIERASGAGAFSATGTVRVNITSYTDTSVAPGSTYSYRVIAVGVGGDYAPSSSATVTTSVLPPSGPSGLLVVSAPSGQVDVSWTDTSSDETSFRVERGVGAGAFIEIAGLAADVTSHSDGTVFPATTYSYRVRASNSGGDSPYSAISTVSTLILPPVAPSGLSALAIAATQINLSWLDNGPDEAGFRIERALGSGSFTEIATVGANVTAYADSTVVQATSYSYRVRGYNAGGLSPYSATASATPP